MSTTIRLGHKRITGYNQVFAGGGLTPRGVPNVLNLAGGAFPAQYDPARLGNALIVGSNFQNLNIGSDGGYTALQNDGGWFVNNTPVNFPPVVSSAQVVPSSIFNQVVRFGQLKQGSHPEVLPAAYEPCVSKRYDFPTYGNQPGQIISIRSTCRMIPGPNNIISGVPKFSAINSDLNGVSCHPGFSDSWKMWFLWQVGTNAAGAVTGTNSASRHENVFLLTDRHSLSAGQIGSQGGTNTQILNTSSNNVRVIVQGGAPNKPIGMAAEGLAGLTNAGEMFYNGLLVGKSFNSEFYESIFLFICEDATHFTTLHACRKISTGGGTVLDQSSLFAWTAHRSTCNPLYPVILGYFGYQLGGNKSAKNCMPDDQYHEWGPFEVSKGDTYNMVNYVL